jgi:hypothetical protein
MGGALQTLGQLAAAMVASNKAFVKAEALISVSSGITFSAGNSPQITLPPPTISGYTSTRGDGGHVTVQLSASASGTVSVITFTNTGFYLKSFDIDCNSAGNSATSTGITMNVAYRLSGVKVSNCTSADLSLPSGNGGLVMDSEFTGATSTATAAVNVGGVTIFLRNYVHDNATSGYVGTGYSQVITQNIFYNNLGATADGISLSSGYNSIIVTQNTVDSSGRHGINYNSSAVPPHAIYNNILSNWGLSVTAGGGHGLVGANGAGEAALSELDGNCYYAGSSGGAGSPRMYADDTTANTVTGITPYRNQYDQILASSPYKNAPTDFSLNAAAGGGAACIGTGLPQAFPGLAGTTGHPNMGAAGANAASSAGGNLVVVR